MQKTIEYLRGKKTVGTAAIALLYLAGVGLGWCPYDERVIEVLGFAGLAFLRVGMKTADDSAIGK
jgi:hypothetical protein